MGEFNPTQRLDKNNDQFDETKSKIIIKMNNIRTEQLVARLRELEEQVITLKQELINILIELTSMTSHNPIQTLIRIEQLENRVEEVRSNLADGGTEMLNIINELNRR